MIKIAKRVKFLNNSMESILINHVIMVVMNGDLGV